MTNWHPDAVEEIARFARSRKRLEAEAAGSLVELAIELDLRRLKTLPRLRGRNPEIRWWEDNGISMYVRVVPPPIQVVKVGRTTTQKLRDDCEANARERSTT
ncbi:hypothetical protein HFP89_08275 [Wenzhouxiangella sp. XN79A]|uniref:hypothetical protein n=1 Tax=Wenzhouxiangella sp. XN79A TaxID=2724193 RepID=UPI00144A661F|nr:hypothetical protein [Wenzhouxiangella sp. XN79A]NKI35160.1 hypothetical protein [Wenzhouxiangella sp. XN79A]